jgi:hypothetical protein
MALFWSTLDFLTRRLPSIPWYPSVVSVDDFAAIESRDPVDPDTGKPVITYEVMARVDNMVFYVGSIDFNAYIVPTIQGVPAYLQVLSPAGDARWSKVEDTMDMILSRWESHKVLRPGE